MEEKQESRILSDRAMREWIPSCPVQIKKIRLVRNGPEGGIEMAVEAVPCGSFGVASYTADAKYQNDRREEIGGAEGLVFTPGSPSPVSVPFEKAVYASVTVTEVRLADGGIWKNEAGDRGAVPPDQAVVWQTDPLYKALRRECDGVTEARYWPDEIPGAWRCVCGQINLDRADACGSCGVSRAWLAEHLDRDYLKARAADAETKTERELEREKKRKQRELGDKVKAGLILAAAVFLVVLSVLTVRVIVPTIRYNRAGKLLDAGDYDGAIALYGKLGKFSDSAARMNAAVYEKAKFLTGLDEVNMTDSVRSPWFSVTEDGILSLRKDKYEDAKGSWSNFVVPDMVDGVIVRELDRNFFLNCKELTVATLSDCVEVIGEQAFYNCDLLCAVNFGKNTRVIGPRCFINCPALEEITIPDTVEALGLRAFNNCKNLKKAVLGKGVRTIGAYTFSNCPSLERITLTSPLTAVDEFAFADCPAFRTIYCRFAESEWTDPAVGEGNEAYLAAEKVFGQ